MWCTVREERERVQPVLLFWWKVREEECAFEMGNAKAGRQAKQSKAKGRERGKERTANSQLICTTIRTMDGLI